jgi:hypothetical protein
VSIVVLVVWVVTSEVKWELMADINIRVINGLVPRLMVAFMCTSVVRHLVVGLHGVMEIAIWV